MSENADIPAVNEDSNRHSYPPVLPDEAVGASATASTSQDGGEHSGNKATSAIARPATRASSYATANESDDDDGEQYGQYRGIGPLSLEASQRAAASPLSVQARPVDGHESSDNDVNEDEDGDTHSSHSSEAIETGMTPAAQLRLSLARRLWSGVTQLRSRSRCVLLFQGAFTIAQVGAFITMLALSAHQPCNKPLRVFIALHVIRIVVAYPISFYNALAPPQ